MAVKGNAYIKTSWAYGERPVPSSKLNNWDDRIEASLELVHRLLSLAWGGGDGVLRRASPHDLQVVALSPPGLSVEVKPGYAFISKFPYRLDASIRTADIIPPVNHPRIDLIQARLAAWDVGIVTGTESSNPPSPSPDADCLALARLYLRVGMTCIKNTDDSLNGHIIDVRSFL